MGQSSSKRSKADILPSAQYSTQDDYDSLNTSKGTGIAFHARTPSSSSIQFPPKPSYHNYASSSSVPLSPGYVPGLQHPPAHPSQQHLVYPAHNAAPSYPSVKHTFRRLARVLEPVYPELWDTLSYGLPASQMAPLEASLHVALPRDVKDYLLLHDGQDIHSLSSSESPHTMGLFWGLWMMTSEEIVQEWNMLRMLERKMAKGQVAVDDPFSVINLPARVQKRMKSCPPGWVRPTYSHHCWVPLIKDDQGNYIGIDLDPPEQTPSTPQMGSPDAALDWSAVAGRPGQVIAFGRDMDTKTVLFPGWGSVTEGDPAGGWARFLSAFADDLDAGEFGVLGDRDISEEPLDDSDQSDDGIGDLGYYESSRDTEDSFAERGSGRRKRASLHVGGSGSKWRLRHPYKHLGVIQALCLRSKKRWQGFGVVPVDDLGASTSSSVFPPSSLNQSTSSQTTAVAVEEPLPSSPHLTFSPPSPKANGLEELPIEDDPPPKTDAPERVQSPPLAARPARPKRVSTLPPVSPVGVPTLQDLLLDEGLESPPANGSDMA